MLPKKKNESTKAEGSSEQDAQEQSFQTVLAEGVLFKGDFNAEEPMLVHGQIQGNIKSTSDVTLSATAQFKGSLEANNTIVSGIAEGDIHCKDTARMEESGEVKGDIQASRFIMSEDSVFTGKLKVKKKK